MLRVIVAAVGGFIFGAGATAGLLFTLGNPRQIDSDVSADGMRRIIGPGLGDTPAEAMEHLGEIVSQMARDEM